MAQQSSVPTSSDPPPFDPTEPSTPIAFPIKTLEDLESRAYFKSFHYPFNRSTVALQPVPLPDRRRMLVCHDMAGGYKDDKWVQGGTNPDAYAIWHWYLIDVFVYFSHDLVTLPPPCWTNTAHRHGVKVLGTFILEGGGEAARDTLLSTNESAQMYAERLTELAIALGFDGWLMNMEISMNSQQIPYLKEFVSHLTQSMHSKLPGSLVIWYDSVTVDGKLDWQDQLNEKNKPFFDICDGIYVNYGWKEETPKNSAAAAGERKYDVYMGIDVFGRGTYGGGEWNTNVALDVLRKEDVSAAIFAPGWVYEHKQETDFQTAQNKWWNLVKKSWGIVQSYPKQLPFYSNFDQGHGYHVSIDGEQISDAKWNNLSSQGFQPMLEVTDASTSHSIQAYLNFKEAYNGGGSIALEGSLERNGYTEIRLFQGELVLDELPLKFMYSSKTNGDSQLGLSLEFLSSTNKRKLLLAPSTKKKFSNDFSEVIETTPLELPGLSPDWFVQAGSIQMNGYKLTNINILCYRSSHENDEPSHKSGLVDKNNAPDGNSSSEYFAMLGNITLRSHEEPDLPPYNSWLIEGQYIKWTPSPEGTRTLDIKIVWKLKDSRSHTVYEHYNIYVIKVGEKGENRLGELHNVAEYLGVTHVEAFYVSNLAVPSSTSGLKFMIQVCGVDGSSQRLEDSPFLKLQKAAEVCGVATMSEVVPFDPTEPSIPIAYPIKTLAELESRAYFKSFHYPFNVSTVALPPASLPNRRRMLVCHDMAGGYLDDKWVQGGSNPDAYAIWHWYLMDVFMYFSHDLVTLPPPVWTNTAHRHGVKVLGTFIVEGGGKDVRDTLLASKDSAEMYAGCLTELAVALGFDGWLMNMEISMNSQQVLHLKEFVSYLTQSMHSKLPGSLVIWYDSVTVDGRLRWQNELNEKNKPFFDISDGIFVNYGWKEDTPKSSAAAAGERQHDVYMGIDVFGRGTFGGGGWDTNVALDVLRKDDVSVAIFAPGWVYEHPQETDFQIAQNKWWNLVKKSWEIVRSYPKLLPFYSNFDQGHGYQVSINGVKISDASWNNLSSQSFQPILEVTEPSTSHPVKAYSDFEEVFNGGGSIAFKGTLEPNCHTKIKLFQGEVVLGEDPLVVMYSSKSSGDSQLGLSLEFLSSTNKRELLLVSSIEKKFSNDFSEVIETTPLEVLGLSPDWLVQMGRIQMDGYKLTNINTVCYRSSPETGMVGGNSALVSDSSSNYFAVLGNIIIRSVENPVFPPYSSWLVKSEYIKWTSSPEGKKTLDIKIIWELKDSSSDMVFERYNVYVMQVVKKGDNRLKLQNVPEYLGVAHVEAFYVSSLAVPSSISGFKFIIQVCGVDGSIQKLEDSPFLYVDAEGH